MTLRTDMRWLAWSFDSADIGLIGLAVMVSSFPLFSPGAGEPIADPCPPFPCLNPGPELDPQHGAPPAALAPLLYAAFGHRSDFSYLFSPLPHLVIRTTSQSRRAIRPQSFLLVADLLPLILFHQGFQGLRLQPNRLQG